MSDSSKVELKQETKIRKEEYTGLTKAYLDANATLEPPNFDLIHQQLTLHLAPRMERLQCLDNITNDVLVTTNSLGINK